MSFKVGDKVVYIGGGNNPDMRYPTIKTEVCIIKSIDFFHSDYYDLVGYERNDDGVPQCFHETHLKKVDEDNHTTIHT